MHENTHDIVMTMVTAITAGIALIVLARKLALPAIVLLLLGGVALGPEGLGWAKPESLGDGLLVIVSMSVGLILFEGGLTLDVDGYRSAPQMIRRLLSIGILTTWFATAAALWFVAGRSIGNAIATASLVIVTGPTVIAPLLKRVRVNEKLHSILHWEGVLIDPIGVFIAVLCFEWFVSGEGSTEAFTGLGTRVLAGLVLGVGGGLTIGFSMRRRYVPEDMLNVFVLAAAVLVWGIAELLEAEAGLLSATVAGFVLGLSGTARVKQIRRFKAELTDLLVGTLFILLAARLDLDQFKTFGLQGYLVVAMVIFLVRPLSIMLCSMGLDLSGREKAFLSWVAPRGIVAASMASLFAISMEGRGGPGGATDAQFVETFVYSVIIGTIVLQGVTAGPIAKLLRLQRAEPTGWLIVGAHAFGREIGRFIARSAKLRVVVVDTNHRAVRDARRAGLNALAADARDAAILDRHQLHDVGNVLALTDNEDLNVRICQSWAQILGSDRVYRCNPTGVDIPEPAPDDEEVPGRVVWPRLPRPSLVSGEIQRREAEMIDAPGTDTSYSALATTVAVQTGDRVVLDPLRRDTDKPAEMVLYIRREGDYLMRSIQPELVMRLEVTDLPSLFEQILERVVSLYPKIPMKETLSELVEREAAFPTALGSGVAVPHAFCAKLDRRLTAIVQTPDGVDFAAPDGEPVRLAFLLLSPQGDPEGHLATLAEIARLVHDMTVRKRLIEARSPLAVIQIVHEVKGSPGPG